MSARNAPKRVNYESKVKQVTSQDASEFEAHAQKTPPSSRPQAQRLARSAAEGPAHIRSPTERATNTAPSKDKPASCRVALGKAKMWWSGCPTTSRKSCARVGKRVEVCIEQASQALDEQTRTNASMHEDMRKESGWESQHNSMTNDE